MFADLVPASAADADPRTLLDLELAAAARSPYRDIAAQLHLLARRGETISWSRYLRWGFTYTPPVLLATLAALAGWLWLIR